MSIEGEYITNYESKNGELGVCVHVPRDKDGYVAKGRRGCTHFRIKDKVYKSKKKFLEALKDYEMK